MAYVVSGLLICCLACIIEQCSCFSIPFSFANLPNQLTKEKPDTRNSNDKPSVLKRTFEEKMKDMNTSVTELTKQFGKVEKVSESVTEVQSQMKEASQIIESLNKDLAMTTARLQKQCREAAIMNSIFLDVLPGDKDYEELSFQHAASSSVYSIGAASLAIDGKTNTDFKQGSCTHTDVDDSPWWLGTLKVESEVHMVELTNRGDCCSERMNHISVQVFETDPRDDPSAVAKLCNIIQQTTEINVKVECSSPLRGKYIRIYKQNKEFFSLCEVKAFAYVDESRRFGKAIQSSEVSEARLAIDTDPKTCSETQNEANSDTWWQVDLLKMTTLTGLTITNRDDQKYTFLSNFEVRVYQTFPSVCVDSDVCTSHEGTVGQGETVTLTCEKPMTGRYLRITKLNGGTLSLCDVRVEKEEGTELLD